MTLINHVIKLLIATTNVYLLWKWVWPMGDWRMLPMTLVGCAIAATLALAAEILLSNRRGSSE